jgi:predicted aspartyl protease
MRGFIALVTATVAAAHFAVPFRMIDNREFVDAYVNGKGPYAFVVDTGSVTLITPEVAAAAGVASVDGGLSGGVGEKREPIRQAVLDRFAFGDVSLAQLAVSVGSLREIRDAIGFARLDGIIGSDVLKRYRTRIDGIGASVIQLSDAAPVGVALPFRVVDGEIVVAGSVNGIAGDFIVDTGDRSTLTLFGPFVEKHGLGSAKGVVAVTGWGIGGAVRARVTRADVAAATAVDLIVLRAHLSTTTTKAVRVRVSRSGVENDTVLALRTLV